MSVIDHWLKPVITADIARQLVALKPSQADTNRVLELGDKANEGLLSPAEQVEYDAYIAANDFIATLQSTARQVLRRQTS